MVRISICSISLKRDMTNFPWKWFNWRRITILMMIFVLHYIYSVQDEMQLASNIYASRTWPSSVHLPRMVSEHQYEIMMGTLGELISHFNRMNITAVLWAGSLLGSYMFHDIVPWDDDVDLWISYAHVPAVKRYFRNKTLWESYGVSAYRPPVEEYDLATLLQFPDNATDSALYDVHPGSTQHSYHQFKFFLQSSASAGGYGWRWPFVDVIFYRENATHVWNDEAKPFYLRKDQFYPLISRPLGPHWLMAPVDTGHFLRGFYGSFSCSSNAWLHRTEHAYARLMRRKVECSQLWSTYPQVWSKSLGEKRGEVEILKLGNTTIHSIELKDVKSELPSLRPFNF